MCNTRRGCCSGSLTFALPRAPLAALPRLIRCEPPPPPPECGAPLRSVIRFENRGAYNRVPKPMPLPTVVVQVDPSHPSPEILAEAAARILRGELVAFPTETVYGLGANAFDAEAGRRIFEAKQRPFDDPLIVPLAE